MYVFQLGLIGLTIALIPLLYVKTKGDRNKFRKLAWVAVFFTFDLIMFGSFTRLTDSGLGCPDWPGCYATASPFLAHSEIRAAETALPTGPVTFTKAWIEMIHRYFAMAIGVLIITLMVLAWVKRKELGQSPWLSTGAFLLVCLQGAFGAWTVTMKLQPVIVTTHLLLALTLLGTLTWLASRQELVVPNEALLRWRWFALGGLALLGMQIALGGWVSTNYAVLACTHFPKCRGDWIPPMDFAQGFKLWRALGRTAGGEIIPMDALVAIHWVHRTFAFVVIAYLTWLGFRLRRVAALRKTATLLLLMLLAQLLTGLGNILLKWPLPIAVAHTGGAAFMLLLLVMLNYHIVTAGRLARAQTLQQSRLADSLDNAGPRSV